MNKKLLIPLLVGLPVLAVGGTVLNADAAALAPVTFTKIQYNPPGNDNRSMTSLRNEWVRLTNNTATAVQLKGWTVADKQKHVYTFGTYSLGAGKRVYLHTGPGIDAVPDAQHVYENRNNYIWNNAGDTATLRDATGKQIDTCTWKSGSKPTYC